jgi:TonB family protein
LRPHGRPAVDLMPRFVALSVFIHVFLLLTVPASLLELGRRPLTLLPSEPSEAVILRVMEIAAQALLVGNYSESPEEKPELPPEVSLDVELELVEGPPPTLPALGAIKGTSRRAGGGAVTSPGHYRPPVPVIIVWPRYPPSAQRRGVRGTVVLNVHVTARGDVDRAEVVSGLEDEACREAALESARALKFLPASLDNRPIDAWFSLPVEFGKGRR